MDDLSLKIEIVLNECTRSLCSIEKDEATESLYYKTIFEKFINGPLLQFVKSIQVFLKSYKNTNVYMLCVCLSQIRKCLLMHETTILEQNTILFFEKLLSSYLIKRIQKCFFKLENYLEMLDATNGDESPGIFIDKMNIVLNGLNNREHFDQIKPNIDQILFQAITIAKVSEETDNLEITSSSKHVLKAIQQFEKMNINGADSSFQFDYLSSSLSILERRINTAVLHLISKIFSDPFCIMKKLIKKCGNSVDLRLRTKSDLSSLICDLDQSTDELIQIGLFSVACCKNDEYVIPLKCCISSLELLDSDIVPAIIKFYLDPTSLVKKTFLKLLVNHWVCEINEMKNILDKIIDPFAFTQITLENSISIIDNIRKSDPKANGDLYVKFLNGLVNFIKYIEKIFVSNISKENELSTAYKQFKNALKEYNACLVFNEKKNHSFIDESTKKKLLQRCEIVIKYLTNIQTSIFTIMDDKSLSELENTYYILSKTHQSSTCILQKDECDNSDDLNLMLSTIQLPKSFYNKSERKASKIIYNQEYLAYDETTYGNTITMDITNILDNFIETCNTNNVDAITTNMWEELDIDPLTRVQNCNDSLKKCD